MFIIISNDRIASYKIKLVINLVIVKILVYVDTYYDDNNLLLKGRWLAVMVYNYVSIKSIKNITDTLVNLCFCTNVEIVNIAK